MTARKKKAPAQYRDKRTGRFTTRAKWLKAQRSKRPTVATVPRKLPPRKPRQTGRKRAREALKPLRPTRKTAPVRKPVKKAPRRPPAKKPPARKRAPARRAPAPPREEIIRRKYQSRDRVTDMEIVLREGRAVEARVTNQRGKTYVYTDARSLARIGALARRTTR